MKRGITVIAAVMTLLAATACGSVVAGTPTWPGAFLEKVLLTKADFPAGVAYNRLTDDPGKPDGADGPPSMLSRPKGCSNALTNVIAQHADRGPGSAAKYVVGYNGARIVMTVLSWKLDLAALADAAKRCEHFETFFDPHSPGIPISTIALPAGPDELAYEQRMELAGTTNSFFMSFANVGDRAVFGAAFPTADPNIAVKGTLPQTFTDVVAKQVDRLRAA